jgi:hypothetical protein
MKSNRAHTYVTETEGSADFISMHSFMKLESAKTHRWKKQLTLHFIRGLPVILELYQKRKRKKHILEIK